MKWLQVQSMDVCEFHVTFVEMKCLTYVVYGCV
jgi:hypothetical protein